MVTKYFLISAITLLLSECIQAQDANNLWNEPEKNVHSQPSWCVKTKNVELFITEQGGHMAPVNFFNDSNIPVQPYWISPWQDENLELGAPVLVPMRGDFFCMPFGDNTNSYCGEDHPAHGETASSKWEFVRLDKTKDIVVLTLKMRTKIRKGEITKKIYLVEGQNIIYSQHILQGYSGEMPIGHHCTLAASNSEKQGSLRIAVSEFEFGVTNPDVFSDPSVGNYQYLAINKKFYDLKKVPTLFKNVPYTDCSSFPQRKGFTDLFMLLKRPSREPAWTTVTCAEKGYLWFSLKDAKVLPGTIFWMSNHGRHIAPWNGRNCCIGIEDVCAYFATGLAQSNEPNPINNAGFATTIELSSQKPTTVNYIQGVVKIPHDFDVVNDVKFGSKQISFISKSGKQVTANVYYDFLQFGKLPKCTY